MSVTATDAPGRRAPDTSPDAAGRPDLVLEAGPIDWPGLAGGARGHLVLTGRSHLAGMPGRQLYLASPVTSWVEAGFAVACEEETARIWGELTAAGLAVASPVLQSLRSLRTARFDVRDALDRLDHQGWMRLCLPLLEASAAVVVAPMSGWRASRGIWAECCWAVRHDRPVILLEPLDG